jgi:hypothetical protein
MVIKRIAPLSAAKIGGLIYAMIALLFGFALWIVSLVGLNISGLSGSPFAPVAPQYIVVGGAVAVLTVPVVYGIFGFLVTLAGAWFYNLIADIAGGIRVEVQQDGADVPR